MACNDNVTSSPAVVIVPFVAQGHLTPLYHLSRIISSYNIPVHFVSTTNSINQLESRYDCSVTSTRIQFYKLNTPPFTPAPRDLSNPFPTHFQPAIDSSLHLRHPTTDLIRSISQTSRKVVVIHDVLMSYVVQDVVSIPNCETYLFNPVSVFDRSIFLWEKTGKGAFPLDQELMNKLPSLDGCYSHEFMKFVAVQRPFVNLYTGALFNTSRVIEGKFIEYIEKKEIARNKKLWALGPLNPVHIDSNVTDSTNRHKCLQWLDKQPANSVLYVAFGTTITFSDEQIKELALGLERSGQRFLWVVRAADSGGSNGFEDGLVELPLGFEERVSGRGLIERSFAPQLEILEHSATGGFMSPCGWNSSIESICMGVPLATWPIHTEQPRNAFLIKNDLKIGMVVRDWERKNELVKADVVADAVKALMASKEGEEMRQRAMKLAEEVKESMAEGGLGQKEINSFISYICGL